MTKIALLALLLLPSTTLAVSSVGSTPEDPASIREEITGLESRLAGINGEMKALKAKDYDELTEQERTELTNLAWDYDQVARRIEWRRQALSGGRGLASERHPAANRAVEHLNGTCPFVNEALTSAASLREGGIRWKENGMLELKDSLPATVTSNTQTFTVRADGLPFRPAKKDLRTFVSLELGDGGKLRKLNVEQKNLIARWYQTYEFEWKGDQCQIDRVISSSPDIVGKLGVTYDRGICQALEGKGLLDEKKAGECSDYNEAIGATIERSTRDWKDSMTFALYTTDPMGVTRLKPWKRKDHVAVNANIARDCLFHLKKGGSANPAPEVAVPAGPAETVAPAQ